MCIYIYIYIYTYMCITQVSCKISLLRSGPGALGGLFRCIWTHTINNDNNNSHTNKY